jgi:hypothetical protein
MLRTPVSFAASPVGTAIAIDTANAEIIRLIIQNIVVTQLF